MEDRGKPPNRKLNMPRLYETSEQLLHVGQQLHVWCGRTRITLCRNRRGVYVRRQRASKPGTVMGQSS